jgi:hypothetical protein
MPKKQKKSSVPKRIAGVKVPKALRRGLRDLAGTQKGKLVLAEALVVVSAAVAAANPKTRGVAADLPKKAKKRAKGLATEFRSDGATLAAAFAEAKRSFIDTLQPAPPTPVAAAPEAPTPH